ncbi:MAG: hypothetical protein LBM28_05080 [Oscillospiraceae bacterium]|jgi:hypothetical protein|nr:hypothetical protein [Oscillospiraceae bacterium]
MKKLWLFLLLAMIVVVAACAKAPSASTSQKDMPGFDSAVTGQGEGWEKSSEGKNFALWHHPGEGTYYYRIFDSEGNIREEGGYSFSKKQLFVEQISDSIVRIRSWTGVAPGTQWCRYYSASRDAFSPVIWGVFDEFDELVVYQSTHRTLIVRNLFDEQTAQKEISTFSQPPAEIPAPFQNAQFSEDGKSVDVTYLVGEPENLREITERIALD